MNTKILIVFQLISRTIVTLLQNFKSVYLNGQNYKATPGVTIWKMIYETNLMKLCQDIHNV